MLRNGFDVPQWRNEFVPHDENDALIAI